MRKIAALFLCICLLFSILPYHSYAIEDPAQNGMVSDFLLTQTQTGSLVSALRDYELQKSILGLEAIDFNNLYIGDPVQTYVYCNNDLSENNKLYPIYFENRIILLALTFGDYIQLTNGLVEEINTHIQGFDSFSVIYDREKTYLYTNDALTLLATHDKDDTRSVLYPSTFSYDFDLPETIDVTHIPMTSSRSNTIRLDVDFVSQNLEYLGLSESRICWAASAACIINYLNGTSLNAERVAKNHLGSGNFNEGIDFTTIDTVLDYYGITYTCRNSLTSDNIILANLTSGYPIASNWTTSQYSSHTCVIYGLNTIAGYCYLMNPEVGFTSAVAGVNNYHYTNTINGATYTLSEAACHSW